jgi:hypothetical protein
MVSEDPQSHIESHTHIILYAGAQFIPKPALCAPGNFYIHLRSLDIPGLCFVFSADLRQAMNSPPYPVILSRATTARIHQIIRTYSTIGSLDHPPQIIVLRIERVVHSSVQFTFTLSSNESQAIKIVDDLILTNKQMR